MNAKMVLLASLLNGI